MASLFRLIRHLSSVPVYIACVALFILMVMTFCDVILRSIFNAPIEAATELTRILMAILVFAVLPVMSARGDQIAVDLTDGVFARFRLTRVRDGLVFLFSGIMLFWPES